MVKLGSRTKIKKVKIFECDIKNINEFMSLKVISSTCTDRYYRTHTGEKPCKCLQYDILFNIFKSYDEASMSN